MTNIENGKQKVESTESVTWDELLEMKKQLAEIIVRKLQEENPDVLSIILEEHIVNYMTDDGTLSDIFHDKILMWSLWEAAWVITPTLKKYREQLVWVSTKAELEELKSKIFKEISWNDQSTSEPENSNTWQKSSSGTKESATSWAASSSSKLASTSSETAEKANVAHSNESTEKAKEGSGESHEIDRFDIIVSPEVKNNWENLKWKEKPDLEPYACAMKAYEIEKSDLKNKKYVTVIDFTKNQLTQNRFFVINLETNTVEYAEKCWHWVNSGGRERTTSFSNRKWSLQSSLWAFITANHSISNNKGTWQWNFWTPLEKSNSNLRTRGCAIHPVGSLIYRSWKPTSEWCFTIPRSQRYVNEILHKIEWKSLVFAYAKSRDYFAQSDYFQQRSDGSVAA